MKKRIAFAVAMGWVTTGIISFTLVSINAGYNDKFFKIWLRSWLVAWLVAVLAILFIGPAIQKLINRVFP